jgi:hypothetical protein
MASPTQVQHADWKLLAEHPGALLHSVGVAMQATEGRALTYLPSAEWTPSTVPPKPGITGEQGASGPTLRAWLDSLLLPWWPAVLATLGVTAGVVGTVRRTRPWSWFAQLAGVTALSAVGLAAFAVLGDGYFEIAKHTWLAAYLLDVTTLALIGALVTATVQAVRSARSRTPQPEPALPESRETLPC